MPIDPRIALGVQPLQLQMPDPAAGLNSLMRVMQIGGAMDEQKVNALKLQELQRGVDETNRLNSLYSSPGVIGPDGTIDRTKLLSGMAGQGLGSRIPALQKQLVEADTAGATLEKTRAETRKADLEAGIKKTEHIASVLSQANPANYGMVRGVVKNTYGMDLPEQFDPNFIAATVAQGQTLTQRLAAEHQRLTLAETQRHAAATEGLTARGQDMADRRAGAQLAQSERHFKATQANAPRGQFIETTGGYVLADPKTGAIRPVLGADGQPLKGKAADKNLTDSQAKANLFGSRMQEADRILTDLQGKYMPGAVNAKMAAGDIPVIGGVAGYAGNLMLSEQGQQAEQAERDFINAVLRRESGAAIATSEFANAKKQYLPQPGDSPAVLAQKKRNRQLAISGLEAEVPGGFRAGPSLTNPTGNTGGASGSFGDGWSIQKVN